MAQWSGAAPQAKAVVGFRVDPQPPPQWKLKAIARYIEEKRSKERQPARLPPKKSACLRQAEPPAASLQDVDNEEQLLRQELADLYAARNKLLWLLRRATEVEIHRNHDPSRYSSTAGSGSGGNRR